MIIWIKRLLLTATFLALIATNILTLTSAAFNAAVSGVMATALGIRTVSSALQDKSVMAVVSALRVGEPFLGEGVQFDLGLLPQAQAHHIGLVHLHLGHPHTVNHQHHGLLLLEERRAGDSQAVLGVGLEP